MKKVFIKTYGCQMNVYDSNRMAATLAPIGYDPSDGPEGADLVILNTCHIREKAAEKIFSELGRLNQLKVARQASGKNLMIGVGGCVAQAEGVEIMRRAPYVDMVFGPQTYHRLPEMIARAARSKEEIVETAFATAAKFDALPAALPTGAASAFLSIQEGCDKFCTFCVVPYTRGSEYSRSPAEIHAEAQALVAAGVAEIILLGQNVNAYHGTDQGAAVDLAGLVAKLVKIDGLTRLRYMTSHPRDMNDTLIAAHGAVPELMPYLHLPVQSGSDKILAAMNRGHDRNTYYDTIARLRAGRPDIALSSDFIVGFPGETESDFSDTLDLVRDITFAQAYSFKYSPRPGTPAASLDNQIPEPAKAERLAALQALLADQQRDYNQGMTGSYVDVLFENTGRKAGQLIGRTPYNQAVHVEGERELLGQLVTIKLTETKNHSFEGRIESRPAGAEPSRERISA